MIRTTTRARANRLEMFVCLIVSKAHEKTKRCKSPYRKARTLTSILTRPFQAVLRIVMRSNSLCSITYVWDALYAHRRHSHYRAHRPCVPLQLQTNRHGIENWLVPPSETARLLSSFKLLLAKGVSAYMRDTFRS